MHTHPAHDDDAPAYTITAVTMEYTVEAPGRGTGHVTVTMAYAYTCDCYAYTHSNRTNCAHVEAVKAHRLAWGLAYR